MSVKDLVAALSAETGVPHVGEDLGPGISQISPLGFQPGEASYFIRIEHVALRNSVTVEAAPFSGRLLASVVERLGQKPEIGDELGAEIAALGWRMRRTPVAASPVLYDAREDNAVVNESEETRQARLADVCIRLTRFMLGSLAVTQVPPQTRAAKRRDETTAQNVSWEYDPAERDRNRSLVRRLGNEFAAAQQIILVD